MNHSRKPAGLFATKLIALFSSSFALLLLNSALSSGMPTNPAVNHEQPIKWKTLSDPSDYGDLESWRRGVGTPLIIVPSEAQVVKRLDSLVIVSWNTLVGGSDLSHFINDLKAGKLTGDEPIREFVLLLQEVFRRGPSVPAAVPASVRVGSYIAPIPPSGERIDISETARRHGLSFYYVPSMRNGKRNESDVPEDRGNAILSTVRLSSFTAFELPYGRQRRLAIGANISGETTAGTPWTIRVINVHLENRATGAQFFQSFGSDRLRQVKDLVKACLGPEPTVLGGDFNTWFRGSQEPAIRYIRQFFDLPTASPNRGTVKASYFLPEREVDYLFFRLPQGWNGYYQRVEKLYGSDHYPLIGEIRIAN